MSRLKSIIIGTAQLMVCLVPIAMSTSTSEMFEFPKMLIIYLCALIVTSMWVIGVARGVFQLRVSRIFIPLGLWVISQVLSTLTSVDPHTSIYGYYGRFNGGLLSTGAYAMLMTVLIQVAERSDIRRLMLTSLLTATLVTLWGMPGRFLGFDLSCLVFRHEIGTSCWVNEFRPQERMFSTLGQPNWLGTYLVVHVFVALSLMKERWTKHPYLLLASILCALGVYLTGSRSAQLGMIIGYVIILWGHHISHRSRVVRGLFITGVVCVMLVMAGIYQYTRTVTARSDVTDSGSIRLIVWRGAVDLWRRYPVLGTGPETFAYMYPLTRPAAHNLTSEHDFIYNKAHNELLNILSTSGAVGLVAYLLLQGYVLMMAYRGKQWSYMAALVSLHCANFFGFSTSSTQMALVCLIGAVCVSQHEGNTSRQHIPALLRSAIVIGSVIALLYGSLVIVRYWQADRLYATGLSLYQNDESYLALSYLRDAYALRREHVYTDRFALAAAESAYSIHALGEGTKDTVDTLVDLARKLQDYTIRSSPHNPQYWKSRARVYYILVQITESDRDRRVIDDALRNAKLVAPTDLEVEVLRTKLLSSSSEL